MSKQPNGSEASQGLQSTSRSPSAPKWYISRRNGALVPLVPVDELPDGLEIVGFPRQLHFSDLRDMQWVGELPMPEARLALDISKPSMSDGKAPVSLTRDSKYGEAGEESLKIERHSSSHLDIVTPRYSQTARAPVPQTAQASLSKSHGTGLESTSSQTATENAVKPGKEPAKPQPRETSMALPSSPAAQRKPQTARLESTTTTLSSNHSTPTPSGIEPDQSRKVYCSFWIRTGECDYVQPGCYYKHEMPDLATLNNIGFRQVPRWWREKQAAQRKVAMSTPQLSIGPTSTSTKFAPSSSSSVPWASRKPLAAIGSEREQAREAAKCGSNTLKATEDGSQVSRKLPEQSPGLLGSRFAPIRFVPATENELMEDEESLDDEELLISFAPPEPQRSASTNLANQTRDPSQSVLPRNSTSISALDASDDAVQPNGPNLPARSASKSVDESPGAPNPELPPRFGSTISPPSPKTAALEETNARMHKELMEAKFKRIGNAQAGDLPTSSTDVSDMHSTASSPPQSAPSGRIGRKTRRSGRRFRKAKLARRQAAQALQDEP